MSNVIWRIVVDPAVHEVLRKLPRNDQAAVERVIDGMALHPYGGDIQKLGGQAAWRRRVRDYRLKFFIYQESRSVFIYELKRRTTNTY